LCLLNKKNKERKMSVAEAFFQKMSNKTSHETLATLNDGTLVPGYEGPGVNFYTHINYYTMKAALTLLEQTAKPPYVIVETGCAAHGTKSTLLWDAFVQKHGGRVYSVDLDAGAVRDTNAATSGATTVSCQDSVTYLKNFHEPIDMLYLDSYDVDYLQPAPSAFHHWKEFQACRHLLHTGSVVLIDDTPVSNKWFDQGVNHHLHTYMQSRNIIEPIGKGSLVGRELEAGHATKHAHQYQMLWQVNAPFSNVRALM
jgi:hypothetical protein